MILTVDIEEISTPAGAYGKDLDIFLHTAFWYASQKKARTLAQATWYQPWTSRVKYQITQDGLI